MRRHPHTTRFSVRAAAAGAAAATSTAHNMAVPGAYSGRTMNMFMGHAPTSNSCS